MKKDQLEVILDFDYTIFDAKKFKLALAKSLGKFGVSVSFFLKSYPLAVKKSRGQYNYIYRKHIQLIKQKNPRLPEILAREALESVIHKSNRYLYRDTLSFLQDLNERDFKLILVTHGNQAFQKQKLQHSGLKNYFANVILSSNLKMVTLKRIEHKFGRAFFISDHINELIQIKQHLPKLIPIMKIGSHHSDEIQARKLKIPMFKTLTQTSKYIINETNRRK